MREPIEYNPFVLDLSGYQKDAVDKHGIDIMMEKLHMIDPDLKGIPYFFSTKSNDGSTVKSWLRSDMLKEGDGLLYRKVNRDFSSRFVTVRVDHIYRNVVFSLRWQQALSSSGRR